MSAYEFRDDDRGYAAWLLEHAQGFVLNIRRSYKPSDARVHRAGCRTIRRANPRGGPWTETYVKVCAVELDDLDRWSMEHAGGPLPRCGVCLPMRAPRQATARRAGHGRFVRVPVDSADRDRYELGDSSGDGRSVEAWADDYVRFERRPEWQERLRRELRERLRRLQASPGEVLQATFYGHKPARGDVENLLIYNIDPSGRGSLAAGARYGIRFELAERPPPAGSGREYPVGYRYALVPRTAGLGSWRDHRRLAWWEWTELGAFAGEKHLEQVWLALSRGERLVAALPVRPDTPFAVRVVVRPPTGVAAPLATLIKGIFDGVICAFQAHGDAMNVTEVAGRIAARGTASSTEVEDLLLDARHAVLGIAPQLVRPYRDGVKWDPVDDLCVAGELLTVEPTGAEWALRGEIVELAPR
jgi:hypothetical protein